MGAGGTTFPFAWPFPAHPGPLYKAASRLVLGAVGTVSKLWLDKLNKLQVHGPQHVLLEAIEARRPVLSFTNHISNVDDPFLWGQLPWSILLDPVRRGMRWAPCAVDICFTNALYKACFTLGQCVPFLRDGSGVYQPGVDFCIERLNVGAWVHIYPQGRCNVTLERMRLKWGIGRMLAECAEEVLLLPYYHCGMDDVLPMRRPYLPRVGKRVTVLYGQPVPYTALKARLLDSGATPRQQRAALTDLCQDALYDLWAETERIHRARTD